MLTAKEIETISYYDNQAEYWAQKHGQMKTTSFFQKQMDNLFKLKPAGRILEVGSGYGKEASLLIKQFGSTNYLGIDASNGLLKIAKIRNPESRFINKSIYDIPKLKVKRFDIFWISAMLIHIPKDRVSEALNALKQKLNKNAVGFISILDGNADMENSRPGRYYTLWNKSEFTDILVKLGFKVIQGERVKNDSPEGNDWLTYLVRI